jgi:hypothetical protein
VSKQQKTNLLNTLPLTTSTAPSKRQAQPIRARDGEVVVYKRQNSTHYQCRFKLADGTWHRQTTHQASIETAIAAACELYDRARFRQSTGLKHKAHRFAQVATEYVQVLLSRLSNDC